MVKLISVCAHTVTAICNGDVVYCEYFPSTDSLFKSYIVKSFISQGYKEI